AFIPGGSTGIGLAIAKRLAARGADVALFARRAEPLSAAAEAVRAARRRDSQRVTWRQLDVADARQVSDVFAAAVAELGPPGVLINCAGRAIPGYFECVSLAQLEESLQVNFYGCWHAVSALLPHLRNRRAYIVNVSSLAGLIGVFGYTDY